MCTKQEAREIAKGVAEKLFNEEKVELYNQINDTINNRIKHLEPSPSTLTRFDSFDRQCDTRTTNFKHKLELLNRDVAEVRKEFTDYRTIDMEWKSKLDKNIAWLIKLIVGSVITAIMILILKQ